MAVKTLTVEQRSRMVKFIWKPRFVGSCVPCTTYKGWTIEHYIMEPELFMATRNTAKVLRSKTFDGIIELIDNL